MPRADSWLRVVLRWPDQLYRLRMGWVLGHRFLRLTHVGRRSGRRYTTVRLLGWRYDGSAEARWRLVEQLPLIAFRPAAH